MATPNIVPRADSEGQLGTSAKYWAAAYIDLIYVGAGKMGRDSTDLIDFSNDNRIVFRTANQDRLSLDQSQFYPINNDGLSLGSTSESFSDLFLASGAVINFDNGNATLTHSNDRLKINDNTELAFGDGQDLKIKHDATNTYIDNSSGIFYITQSLVDGDLVLRADNGSGTATPYLTLDGGVVKTLAHKPIKFDDNISAEFGADTDMIVYHSGSNGAVENYIGNLTITNNTNDGDINFKSDDGSGGLATYMSIDGGGTDVNFFKDTHHIDNVTAKFGTGTDLQIVHNGTDSQFFNSTGNLFIGNLANDKDVQFACDNGAGGDAIYFYLDGSSATHDGSATTALYTNWPDKSRISLGTSHDFSMRHDGTNTVLNNNTGDLYFMQSADDKDIIFQASTGSATPATYITLDGSSGFAKFSKSTQHGDSILGCYGAENDLQLLHNGTNSFIQNGTGDLTIKNTANDKDIIFQSEDGGGNATTYFTVDGSARDVVFAKDIVLNDNVVLRVGTGHDLQIYHASNDSYIDNNLGHLYITNLADDKDIIFRSDDGSGGITTYFKVDAASQAVTFVKHAYFTDNVKALFGNSSDLQILHDGSHSYIHHATNGNLNIKADVGNINITNFTNDADIVLSSDNGSGGTTAYLTLDGSATNMKAGTDMIFADGKAAMFGDGGDAFFKHDGSNFSFINDVGNVTFTNRTDDGDIIFQSDNGSGGVAEYFRLDGGSTLNMFSKSTLHFDGVKAFFGNSSDLEIFHDGSNSYIKDVGTGTLNISGSTQVNINAANGENGVQIIENAGVKLRHNNVVKLDTLAGGILVTGATGTAEGGGIDATDAVSIQVGEINGEIITTIFVDIGVGSIQSSSTNTGAIGNGTDAAAYITQVTTAINGIVYKAELICVEVPTVASGALSVDIDLTANSSSIASGSAVSGTPICNSGGNATLGRLVKSSHSSSNTITPDDYLYLAQGNTNAGVYNAGKFLIRLYGAKTTGL